MEEARQTDGGFEPQFGIADDGGGAEDLAVAGTGGDSGTEDSGFRKKGELDGRGRKAEEKKLKS